MRRSGSVRIIVPEQETMLEVPCHWRLSCSPDTRCAVKKLHSVNADTNKARILRDIGASVVMLFQLLRYPMPRSKANLSSALSEYLQGSTASPVDVQTLRSPDRYILLYRYPVVGDDPHWGQYACFVVHP